RDTGLSALNEALAPASGIGLQSIDPELAITLNNVTDDSNLNAVVVYHQLPTEADLSQLNGIGIVVGLRFRTLPMVTITATRDQLIAVSRFQSVRSIYGNGTLTLTSEPDVQIGT